MMMPENEDDFWCDTKDVNDDDEDVYDDEEDNYDDDDVDDDWGVNRVSLSVW